MNEQDLKQKLLHFQNSLEVVRGEGPVSAWLVLGFGSHGCKPLHTLNCARWAAMRLEP